tara:strand:+ start:94 stop:549 length:456 start_codon:yes stop_codon:yes gene_type:complete
MMIDLDEIKQAFSFLDKDNDGTITIHELRNVLISIDDSYTEDTIQYIMKSIDLDQSGFIDLEEFIEFIRMHESSIANNQKNTNVTDEDLLSTFNIFDVDGDGFITKDELENIIIKLSLDYIDPFEINSMMQMADENGDGQISFDEFKKIMS